MILADTSIWMDHFRKSDAELVRQLQANNIAVHPLIIAELALGSLPEREKTLAYLDLLPSARVARSDEVRRMIEAHSLYRRGIGSVDALLIASALLTPHTALWSRDLRLRHVVEDLRLSARLF